MEALLLAGGKAERLGEAAQGLPKPLVPVAGFPLAEYTVGRLVDAGVTRIIVACRAGQEEAFVDALAGFGAEITPVGESEPRGRGGGLRLAGSQRREDGTVVALNGDECSTATFSLFITKAPAPRQRSCTNRFRILPSRFILRFGNIWEQNHVFEPFHGIPLPSGKHMRIAERCLQIRMSQDRLRHKQRLMFV